MRLLEKQFTTGLMVLLLVPLLWGFSASAVNAGESSSSPLYESTSYPEKEREYSAWERRIAQEVIATGQMLEGDPRFEDVVSTLVQRGQSLLPDGSNVTQDWVLDNLRDVLPQIDNKMAASAMNAAINEMARGTGGAANGLAQSVTGLAGGNAYDIGGTIKQTALRSTLEGLKAAASASDLLFLNRLELEYSLTEGGIDEYSVLTVQPLWGSTDLRHNIFAQASYANKQVEDIGADTNERRDTVNAGLAYRYITPDEQHMFGANAFFDHQWPYNHNRMSLGLDYKTSLYGVSFNKYVGLSDWRGRADGYEEKVLPGEDLEVSGRLPQAPELEVFAKGYHWGQEKTPVINPDGDDIWGYQFAAEYTPVNAFTIRSQATRDNEMDDMEGQITMRLNYRFGQGWDDLWERPTYNLDSVLERRFDKVRRNNEIRVQVRQDPDVTARVTFAQGANVSVGQSLAFGTLVTTGGAAGDGATVLFGNGARLDVGQSTQVRIEKDQIVLITGIIQFTSGSGGITVIAVPGGTIDLIGTDVDVRVAGGTTTLLVRDGAADFTDDTGTTRVNAEELSETQDGDGVAPQIRAEGTAIYETHTREAHTQLNLVGPPPSNPKAAPYVDEAVSVIGTLATGNTLTFTVPLTGSVTVTGTPQLRFTLGGLDRLADYASGSGTTSLTFTYTLVGADSALSNIVAEEIEKNGGTLTGTNGAPMIRTLTGGLTGTVPDVTAPSIVGFTAVSSGGDPAVIGDVITVTLNANEDLVQSGAPSLTLDIGGISRVAAFSAINAGNAEFTYTVQAGDNDADGITITAITIAANELEDASGNDLDTTFVLPHNLGLDVLDVTAPSIVGFTAVSSGGDPAVIGDVITVTLNANEDLVQSGAPSLTLDIGGISRVAAFSAINAGNAEFTYTVQAGDNDADGITITAITIAANDLEDASGNDLDTTFVLPHNLGLDVSDCPAIGNECADGSIYAGLSPDGNVKMYTTPADAGAYRWNNGTANFVETAMVNCTDTAQSSCNTGKGNTTLLAGLTDAASPYAAAAYCDGLIAHGHSDWYLPAQNELNVMYVNRAAIGGFNTSGSWYWSSSEYNFNVARIQRFSDGGQANDAKTTSRLVRCVRR
jgi:hypothetical protein